MPSKHLSLAKPRIDRAIWNEKFHTTVDVLRLDVLHPIVSGNKIFKLQGFLNEARTLGKNNIITFGGAYSNHLLATAATCAAYGLRSIGIVRGEAPKRLSSTLDQCRALSMDLHFVARDLYRLKALPESIGMQDRRDALLIPEGGYGIPGIAGFADLFEAFDLSGYTHLITACGTGTTAAGLQLHARAGQQVMAIPVLNNEGSILKEIDNLLPPQLRGRVEIVPGFQFGGYAKRTGELVDFMNQLFTESGIPTDFVYTAKVFYAVRDMLRKNTFADTHKLLIVHTGGLQGNTSLPKGTLIF